MVSQDNDDYRSRVSKAVIDAVLEAGRARPGDPDISLDINVALDGMCEAMATLAAAVAQVPSDREQGVAALASMEKDIVERLRFFADKIKSGELPPPERPTLRLVK
jgi:hypothetical protein